MKTFLRNALVASTLVAGLATASTAFAFNRTVDISNVSNSTIVGVQISDIGRNDWGRNLLSGVVPANYVVEIAPPVTRGYCRFDIQLTYANGDVWDIYDVNLCDATDIVTDGPSYQVYYI